MHSFFLKIYPNQYKMWARLWSSLCEMSPWSEFLFVWGGAGSMQEDSKTLWNYDSVEQDIRREGSSDEQDIGRRGMFWWARRECEGGKGSSRAHHGGDHRWGGTNPDCMKAFKMSIVRSSNNCVIVIFRNCFLPPHGGHNITLCRRLCLGLPLHPWVSIGHFNSALCNISLFWHPLLWFVYF